MPPKPIQVFVISASPKVRHYTTRAAMGAKRICVARMVDSAQEVLEQIDSDTEQPDVIVLDAGVKGVDGVTTIRALLTEYMDAEIVALISFLEGITQAEAIKAGAISTLPRNSLNDRMLEWAIVVAHNGMRYRLPALIDPVLPLEMLHQQQAHSEVREI